MPWKNGLKIQFSPSFPGRWRTWDRTFLLCRPILLVNLERSRFSIKKFAGHRGVLSFRGSRLGTMQCALFDQNPKFVVFGEGVIIHSA
jgi:hypothetical protein